MDCVVEFEDFPPALREYIIEHTKPSKMRAQLLEFLQRVACGERLFWHDVRSKSIVYHVRRLRKLGILGYDRHRGFRIKGYKRPVRMRYRLDGDVEEIEVGGVRVYVMSI